MRRTTQQAIGGPGDAAAAAPEPGRDLPDAPGGQDVEQQDFLFSVVAPTAKLAQAVVPLGIVLPPYPPCSGTASVVGMGTDFPNNILDHRALQKGLTASRSRLSTISAKSTVLARHAAWPTSVPVDGVGRYP